MSTPRRHFLKTSVTGASAFLLQPMLQRMRLEASGTARSGFPQRFVFVVKASGIIAEKLIPKTLQQQVADRTALINEDLTAHELPETLKPLQPFQDQLSLVQGLSGKMCRPGHSSWFGAMGVYKTGGEHNSGVILRATVDAEIDRVVDGEQSATSFGNAVETRPENTTPEVVKTPGAT